LTWSVVVSRSSFAVVVLFRESAFFFVAHLIEAFHAEGSQEHL
jgi:hypothetical protein